MNELKNSHSVPAVESDRKPPKGAHSWVCEYVRSKKYCDTALDEWCRVEWLCSNIDALHDGPILVTTSRRYTLGIAFSSWDTIDPDGAKQFSSDVVGTMETLTVRDNVPMSGATSRFMRQQVIEP